MKSEERLAEVALDVSSIQALLRVLPASSDGPILAGDVTHQMGEIAHCHWMATQAGTKPWNAANHIQEGRVEIEKRIARGIVRLLQLANAHGRDVGIAVAEEIRKL